MLASKSLQSVLLSGLVASLGSSCAHVTPVSGVAPTRSAEGVEVTVAADACDEAQEPDGYGWSLTELMLEVRVTNPTGTPILVRPGDIRLRTSDGASLGTLTWGAAIPMNVAAGATKSFDLRFMDRGSLHCGTHVELDTSGSVTAGGHALTTDGVAFTASGAPPIRL